MAKIEVDEIEYAQSKKIRELVGKVMADPKRAAKLEALRKEVEPDAPTPHLDQLKAQEQPIDELRKELEEFKKKTAEEKAEESKNAKLSALEAKIEAGKKRLLSEGWTEDGLKALDEFREKETILDPIHAAAVYEKLHGPVAVPAEPSSGVGGWNFLEEPKEGSKEASNLKKLMDTRGNSEELTMKMARDALADFRNEGKKYAR